MLSEKTYLKNRLKLEYKILDESKIKFERNIKNKDYLNATLNKWIIDLATQKIHEFKLELEILNSRGKF